MDDPVASLMSFHSAIALVHVSDTGLETWGHDPIGNGVIDFEALGNAIVQIDKTEDVVLKIIHEESARQAIDDGVRHLASKGWNFARPGQAAS